MHLIEHDVQDEIVIVDHPMKRKRKSVRFDQRVIGYCIPLLSEISQEEINQLWYNKFDFRNFKQIARLICRESRGSTFAVLLSDSYACSQELLDLWAVHGRSQRGLEHALVSAHGNQRKANRRRSCEAVIDTQDRLQHAGVDDEQVAELISQIASKISEPAREFASRMGLADQRSIYNCQVAPLGRRQSSYILREEQTDCLTTLRRRPSQQLSP
eukprot:CAMPEP_0119024548 /NCGR_PEP_ID=MMETSP1176-20130426/32088_1 /TAXON_ID=265551 /ORGANISM="Synedropsis recta cf, Strain CCMP1620" /LENGTH=213 /DNA_ID=CAMNT_0006979875 /DNA_START=23 /DNA_END=664 /DNA_ORIENTATION=+